MDTIIQLVTLLRSIINAVIFRYQACKHGPPITPFRVKFLLVIVTDTYLLNRFWCPHVRLLHLRVIFYRIHLCLTPYMSCVCVSLIVSSFSFKLLDHRINLLPFESLDTNPSRTFYSCHPDTPSLLWYLRVFKMIKMWEITWDSVLNTFFGEIIEIRIFLNNLLAKIATEINVPNEHENCLARNVIVCKSWACSIIPWR